MRLLKSILETRTEDETKYVGLKLNNMESGILELGPVPDILINISYIVQLPINKIALKDYLKLLTIEEASFLFQSLRFLLYSISPALANQTTTVIRKSFDDSMKESKIVIWLDLLLTAHLMVFTTDPKLSPLITTMQNTINRQQMFYKNVAELGPCLKFLEGNMTLPQKAIGEYTLETIKI